MDQFSKIDDACAVVRYPKGISKIIDVYHRGDRLFVPHGGGFVRVCARLSDGEYTTSHPDVKILELEAEGVTHSTEKGFKSEPRYIKGATSWTKPVAVT